MQADVGIFRDEAGLRTPLEELDELKSGPEARPFAVDPASTTRAGTCAVTCANADRRARGDHSLRCSARRAAVRTAGSTIPATPTTGSSTTSSSRDGGGEMDRAPAVRSRSARSSSSSARRSRRRHDPGDRTPPMSERTSKRTLRIWRGDPPAASSCHTTSRPTRAWSCSTPSLRSRRTRHGDLAVPLELQGGQVRLVQRRDQRQAAAHVQDARSTTCPGRADHRAAA